MSCDITAYPLQPQKIGVLPQPPCSNPGFATTFTAARAEGANGSMNTTASVNPVITRVQAVFTPGWCNRVLKVGLKAVLL